MMKYKENAFKLCAIESEHYGEEQLFIVVKCLQDSLIDNNDKIRVVYAELLEVDENFNYWQKTSKIHTLTIHYDEHDNEYFNLHHKQHFINNFLHINQFNHWYNTNDTKDILIK